MSIPFDRLVIASHNSGKVREIRELLEPVGMTVMSASDLSLPEPEETGNTFEANALLKSRSACECSGIASLADDSGLVVPDLGGDPGIYSARWAGPNKNFDVAMQRLQDEGAKTGTEAYFICVMALSRLDAEDVFFEGRVDGTLIFPGRGDLGFGYDPVFVPNGYKETFAELTNLEKQKISHRARAFEKFLQFVMSEETQAKLVT